jgi:DNA-binding MarR family transcriptional regulator
MQARVIAEYLNALDRLGGRATTTQLREETGLSSSQVHYRHDKLAAQGYVNIHRPGVDAETGRPCANVATLRPEGIRWLNKHRRDEGTTTERTATRATVRLTDESIEQLHRGLDVLISMLEPTERTRLDAFDERLRHIEATLDELATVDGPSVQPSDDGGDTDATEGSSDEFEDWYRSL